MKACLLFGFQRSSEGGEWRVVVVDEALEEVPNKGKMGSYVSKIIEIAIGGEPREFSPDDEDNGARVNGVRGGVS